MIAFHRVGALVKIRRFFLSVVIVLTRLIVGVLLLLFCTGSFGS